MPTRVVLLAGLITGCTFGHSTPSRSFDEVQNSIDGHRLQIKKIQQAYLLDCTKSEGFETPPKSFVAQSTSSETWGLVDSVIRQVPRSQKGTEEMFGTSEYQKALTKCEKTQPKLSAQTAKIEMLAGSKIDSVIQDYRETTESHLSREGYRSCLSKAGFALKPDQVTLQNVVNESINMALNKSGAKISDNEIAKLRSLEVEAFRVDTACGGKMRVQAKLELSQRLSSEDLRTLEELDSALESFVRRYGKK